MNQRGLRAAGLDADGVDQQVIAASGDLLHRAAHGQPGRFQNVPAVDLECVGGAHGPGASSLADSSRRAPHGVPAPVACCRPAREWDALDSSTTAAANTGPNNAPRPASSTPAMARKPARRRARSWRLVGMQEGTTRGRYSRAFITALSPVPADGRPCPSDPADNTAWRGAPGLCAPRRYGPPPERAAGRCAPRPGRS